MKMGIRAMRTNNGIKKTFSASKLKEFTMVLCSNLNGRTMERRLKVKKKKR